MKQIGLVSSGSSEVSARVILSEGQEKTTKVEDLVLIDNKGAGIIVAVLRGGLGSNENLRSGGYHPGVAYARVGGTPSNAKETYDFGISVIGKVEEKIEIVGESLHGNERTFRIHGVVNDPIQQNKKILAPGSLVYLFDDEDQPLALLAGANHHNSVGHYEGHPNWLVQVDESFVPYHIGIFASTGSGKSYLARYQLAPLLQKAGYGVIILDWKGRDYALHYPDSQVISISDISLDPEAVLSYLTKKMKNFGYSGIGGGAVTHSLQGFIYNQTWRNLTVKQFRQNLDQHMLDELNPKGLTTGRPAEDHQRFTRSQKRLMDSDVENILGTLSPRDIVERSRKDNAIVIDMKRTGKDEKLSMFLTLANYLMGLMQNNENLDLALVVDEAPQYCPFKPDGLQQETTDIMIDMCALGRTHKLSISLLSQGIAGEIGINAAVRRNLNTQFVGKIHPLDIGEASNWLDPFNIDSKFLLSLPPGHFYCMGSMNPSPIPLLMTFDIPGN